MEEFGVGYGFVARVGDGCGEGRDEVGSMAGGIDFLHGDRGDLGVVEEFVEGGAETFDVTFSGADNWFG